MQKFEMGLFELRQTKFKLKEIIDELDEIYGLQILGKNLRFKVRSSDRLLNCIKIKAD